MNFSLDVNTLILAGVVGAVGWGLKELAKSLITHLVKTEARMAVLDEKMGDVIKAIGDVQKIRTDLNAFYTRLKVLEAKIVDQDH